MAYLPYVEPGLEIILPLSTFIFILNITRDVLDNFLYCGLIGEIFIGILYGMPITGTSWLSIETQETIQYLGYLGLICLVFEGGLITDLKMLRETIWVTLSAAAIGILMPMALSFFIMGMKFDTVEGSGYPTALAAFSAGVSLCSTSLGSTFIILSSANLQKTPTGTLIAGAAMIDDILVLVMVKIVTALGQGQSNPWRIARPAISSLSLVLATFLLVPFLIKPIYKTFHSIFTNQKDVNRGTFGESYDTEKGISRHMGFILSTLILILLVTIAACVEGSILLSAFIAGAIVRYMWQSVDLDMEMDMDVEIDRPTLMFEEYYKPIMDHILVPFFFASIGFSIPISEMFSPSIIYKGIFYALLMFLAKASVGLILYMNFLVQKFTTPKSLSQIQVQIQHSEPQLDNFQHELGTSNTSTKNPPRPPHLDALIVGSTMIARGGFGFLVASEAQSSGILSLHRFHGLHSKDLSRIDLQSSVNSDTFKRGLENLNVVEDQIFLVIIWALVLCTILGPVVAGVAVRKKVLMGGGSGCACGCVAGRGRGGVGAEGSCHLCL